VHAGRYFDAAIGRWLIPDPALEERESQWLAENGYYAVSPYVYVFNNPLIYIDPTGEIVEITGTEEEVNKYIEVLQYTTGTILQYTTNIIVKTPFTIGMFQKEMIFGVICV
jgi:RHS repeat-associated protein